MHCVNWILLLLAGVTHASLLLPSYIKPCATSDPKFNDCVRDHANEAIPVLVKGDRKYKVPVLDPLEITEIKVDNTGPSNAGFVLTLKDIKMYGFKDMKVERGSIDLDKRHTHFDMVMPFSNILGKYEVSGRILILPIVGNGNINITMVNSKLTFDHDIKLINRTGQTFGEATNHKATVTPSRVYMHLTNLFNGDKLLGKQMNDFIDENWQDVFKELSPPLIEGVSQVITATLNNVGAQVPHDTVYPNTLS